MKTVKIRKRPLVCAPLVVAFGWVIGCSSPDNDSPTSGGSGGSGGSLGSTGGSANPSGGTPATTGGVPAATGGNPSTSGGNQSATGGSPIASGGITNQGGQATSGGVSATGGNAMTGGVTTTGAQGGGGSNGGGAMGTGGKGGGKGGASSGGATGGGSSGGTAGGASGGTVATGGSGGGTTDPALAKFSFFVVSYPAIITLSGKTEGFGGDLRFGKADGLSGADEICRQAAEMGMPGAGQKTWRAFLSATQGPGGTPVNARDRIGTGPWYDRMGRLLAMNLDGLFAGDRPAGDTMLVNDIPNEKGQPNHYVGPNGMTTSTVDNHDTLTGSDTMGRLMATSAAQTCNDWTSTTVQGSPRIGHSWPRSATSGRSWVSDHTVPGCVAGVDRTLGGTGSGSCVGCSGGYGGFYCFALP